VTVSVKSTADTVWALIDAVANLNTWRQEILDDTGAPVDPPLDPDTRVHPYAVVYFGAGQTAIDRESSAPVRTPITFQVSCVGGDDIRCLWAVDQVRTALVGQVVAGGRVVEINDAGPLTSDEDLQPSRTMTHLIFRIHARG
jgi:hypothetical protein